MPSTLADLLPLILQTPWGAPIGGPVLPQPLAKAPSNATTTLVPSAKIPGPYEGLAAMTNLANVVGENALRGQQINLVGAQAEQAKTEAEGLRAIMALQSKLYGGAGAAASAAVPQGVSPKPSVIIPAEDGGGAGGWGDYGPEAVNTMKQAGASDAFIHAAIGQGLAEGGFANPWKQSDVVSGDKREESFGHWQYHKGGELEGYLASEGKENPQSTANQVRFLMRRAEELSPGITQGNDPKKIMDILGAKFERYKGAAPGQRYGYLADAQRLLGGGQLEPRQPLPAVPQYGQDLSTAQSSDSLPVVPRYGPDLSQQPMSREELALQLQQRIAPASGGGTPMPRDQLAAGIQARMRPTEQTSPLGIAPPVSGPQLAQANIPGIPSPQLLPPGGVASPQPSPGMDINVARQIDLLSPWLKRRNPTAVEEALKIAPGGSLSPEHAGAVAGAQERAKYPYKLGEIGAKTEADLYRDWRQPRDLRPGGILTNPATGDVVAVAPTLQRVTDPATGQETWRYMAPPIGSVGPQAGGTGQPAGAPDLGVAQLGPGQRTALETRATEEQKQRQKVIDDANAAQQSQAALLNMAADAGRFKQGPFAPYVQQAARYLRLVDPSWDGQVASYEDFVKNAGQLTRQAVRETSARAAVQEFQMIANTLPSPEMSEIGLRRVQNEMLGLNDFRQAKSQAQAQWEVQHGGPGNVTGFETAFQKQASPYTFIIARMDPADRRELFAKLQSTEAGQKELARLGQQLTSLKQMGVLQ